MFLGFDTTTDTFSVAVGNAEKMTQRQIPGRRHFKKLIPAVDGLLQEEGISSRQIKAVGMGTGPGSFTGIRIGLSFGITFAQVMKISAYGISSVDLAGREGGNILLKAYGQSYYLGRYDRNGRRLGEFKIIDRRGARALKARELKVSAAEILRETRRLYENGTPGEWKKIEPIYSMKTKYRKKNERY